MRARAWLRYITAVALSVALITWLALAQYLGSANTYFATTETAVPTLLFGLLTPLIVAAIGLSLSGGFASLVSANGRAPVAGGDPRRFTWGRRYR